MTPSSSKAADRLSLRAVARVAGVSHTAMQRRYERGDLPPASGVRAGGWPFWHLEDIRSWLEQLPLQQCPVCGVKTKRLRWHVDQRHPGADGAGGQASDVRARLDWLTASQVASELQVSTLIVRELISAGDLPASRAPDGSYQVERLMYERWLAHQYQLTRDFIAAQPFPTRNRSRP